MRRPKNIIGWHSADSTGAQASFDLMDHSGWSPDAIDAMEFGPPMIKFWQQVAAALSTVDYMWRGNRIRIEADWNSVVRFQKRCLEASKKYEAHKNTTKGKELVSSHRRIGRQPMRVNITAMPIDEDAEWPGRAEHFADIFLFDIFLILNIASPGSCNFYGAQYQVPKDFRGSRWDKIPGRKFSLSEFYFEECAERESKKQWPSSVEMDLSEVRRWYFSVRSNFAQIPQSRVERALFALLHMSNGDGDITDVVWVFYALESLFDTKPGQNFSALHRRATQLMSANNKQAAKFKKELRSLYDLRSALVHGGLDVVHPARNEIVDRSVDEKQLDAVSYCALGFSIVVCALQETIRRGWKEPNFQETTHLSGTEIQIVP